VWEFVKLVKNNGSMRRQSDIFSNCIRTFHNNTGIVFIIPIEIVLIGFKRCAGRGFTNLSRPCDESHLAIIVKMVLQQCFISAFHAKSLH